MNKSKILFQLLITITIMSSCKFPGAIKENDNFLNSDNLETKEIRISCGEDDINDYLSDGWIIKKEYSEEKVCTWKTERANRTCDIDKDKGCRITKPDIIGETTIYLLERINQ